MKTAKLIIHRPEEWANRVNHKRKMTVFIDGKYACSVASDKPQPLFVTPGKHKMTAKMDWMSSREYVFEIADEEQKEIVLSCNYRPENLWLSSWVLLVLWGSALLYKGVLSPTFLNVTFALALCCIAWITYQNKGKGLLYYLTIGRKDYLTIETGKAESLAFV